MPITPEARQRLVRLMEDRLKQLDILWQDAARDGGFSLKTLHNLRAGKVRDIQPRTTYKIDAGMRWERGSTARVLDDGGEPVPLPSGPRTPPDSGGAGDAALRPYLMWVQRDLELAEARHGPGFTGADAFGSEVEAAVWDEPDLPRPSKIALLAKMRKAQDARSGTGL